MRVLSTPPAPVDGGLALSTRMLEQRLTHLPRPGSPEPAYAICDSWETPHRLALPTDLCQAVKAHAERTRPTPSPNGTYYLDELPEELRTPVRERFEAANRLWWDLDITSWDVGVKHYRTGEGHPLHQDLHAGAARRKLARVIQLSEPDDYTGGELVMRFADQAVTMPKTLGTLVAFPGWTCHEVRPVTSGQRWSLYVNGRGPALREWADPPARASRERPCRP